MTKQSVQQPSSSQKLNASQLQIQVKINRLQSQKIVLENKLKITNESLRKARTRNLIQLGDLLNMLNLPSICGINEGEDLQTDFEASDKAAVLLGMLAHLEDSLPTALSDQVIAKFKQKGIRVIKNHTAQRIRS
ncbi:MAG: hypothetical protein QG556_134 [Pseudomonadota bacterium]|nr:hypothetical protein [Pseudomonadota bacterium]